MPFQGNTSTFFCSLSCHVIKTLTLLKGQFKFKCQHCCQPSLTSLTSFFSFMYSRLANVQSMKDDRKRTATQWFSTLVRLWKFCCLFTEKYFDINCSPLSKVLPLYYRHARAFESSRQESPCSAPPQQGKRKRKKKQQSAAFALLRKSRAGEFLAGTFNRRTRW